MILPLTKAFKNLISTGCVKELKTQVHLLKKKYNLKINDIEVKFK